MLIKNDKSLRRYATTVERALGTWETAPEEWAEVYEAEVPVQPVTQEKVEAK